MVFYNNSTIETILELGVNRQAPNKCGEILVSIMRKGLLDGQPWHEVYKDLKDARAQMEADKKRGYDKIHVSVNPLRNMDDYFEQRMSSVYLFDKIGTFATYTEYRNLKGDKQQQ